MLNASVVHIRGQEQSILSFFFLRSEKEFGHERAHDFPTVEKNGSCVQSFRRSGIEIHSKKGAGTQTRYGRHRGARVQILSVRSDGGRGESDDIPVCVHRHAAVHSQELFASLD